MRLVNPFPAAETQLDGSATSADPSTARALANGIETPSHLTWLVLAMFAANDEQRSVERDRVPMSSCPSVSRSSSRPSAMVRKESVKKQRYFDELTRLRPSQYTYQTPQTPFTMRLRPRGLGLHHHAQSVCRSQKLSWWCQQGG